MSLVKLKDKRTGTTYIYESESYWDKEKKQPRSHRKLIGKLDEETGEIVPTGKSGRKKSLRKKPEESSFPNPATQHIQVIAEQEAQIRALKVQNQALLDQKQDILKTLEELCRRFSD